MDEPKTPFHTSADSALRLVLRSELLSGQMTTVLTIARDALAMAASKVGSTASRDSRAQLDALNLPFPSSRGSGNPLSDLRSSLNKNGITGPQRTICLTTERTESGTPEERVCLGFDKILYERKF
jgi:hypothetical protein